MLAAAVTMTSCLWAGFTPAVAGAVCKSSTPTAISVPDPVPDNEANGPEVVSVDASIDRDCRLTVDPKIQAPLVAPDEFSSILLDVDPSTGVRGTEIPDAQAFIFPGAVPVLMDVAGNLHDVEAVGPAGFRATLDQIGLAGPVNLGIAAVVGFDDGENLAYDYAPDPPALMHRLPVNFKQKKEKKHKS